MTLPAHQDEVLNTIARRLIITDPKLAAEFGAFAKGMPCPRSPWQLSAPGSMHKPHPWWRQLLSRLHARARD